VVVAILLSGELDRELGARQAKAADYIACKVTVDSVRSTSPTSGERSVRCRFRDSIRTARNVITKLLQSPLASTRDFEVNFHARNARRSRNILPIYAILYGVDGARFIRRSKGVLAVRPRRRRLTQIETRPLKRRHPDT